MVMESRYGDAPLSSWDIGAYGTPYVVPASTTQTNILELPPSAQAIVLEVSTPANITSITVTGVGTGATYASISATPTGNFFVFGVVPVLDDHLKVVVVTNSSGQVLVAAAVLTGNRTSATLLGVASSTAALADATPNPTTNSYGAYLLVWNGTTWDRVKNVVAAGSASGAGLLATGLFVWDGANYTMLAPAAFNVDAITGNRTLPTSQMLWNGASYDRKRSNIDTGALITAAGATTTQTTADQTNYNHRGIRVVLDMTNIGTGSVTLHLQGKDAASGVYDDILVGAAVVGNSHNLYRAYPGLTASANLVVNDILPRTWRIQVVANNANATTYTVGAQLIL